MGLSKLYIDRQNEASPFDPDRLSRELEQRLPCIAFAYLMGSAKEGLVEPHSDLDLAVYLDPKSPEQDSSFDFLDFYSTTQRLVEEIVGPVRCDLGILNKAEPVYRFEALKGRLLFSRNEELRASFYSLTCREYEHQLFDYERQRRYRLEAAGTAEAASSAAENREERR